MKVEDWQIIRKIKIEIEFTFFFFFKESFDDEGMYL